MPVAASEALRGLRTDLSKKDSTEAFVASIRSRPRAGCKIKKGGLVFFKRRAIPLVEIFLRTGGWPYIIITIINL